jgi:hypothetical protein
MTLGSNTPHLVPGPGKVRGLDSRRIFRPEAVEAYTTRRAGEAWEARPRLEAWIIAGLTMLALAGAVFIWLGGR